MRIKNVSLFLIIAVVMIFSFCFNLHITGAVNASHGIYMKVSRRVIQTETIKDIRGVYIRVFDASTGEAGEATSDYNWHSEIKRVPPGIYQILVEPIHRTCPVDLILERSG